MGRRRDAMATGEPIPLKPAVDGAGHVVVPVRHTREVLVRTAMTAVAATAVACAAVSGCTINLGNPTPSGTAKVSKEDLQKDISQRVTNAGQTPQSVSCPDDLLGQPGQSTRCEVTMSATNSFEPIVTVTSVEGTKVNYDITPAVSQTQLEASVSQMVANSTKAPVASVSCQSGLQGKIGALAYCDVTTQGATTRRTVEVTNLSGLQMNYDLVPVLPKAVAANSLLFQMNQIGKHPDSATCAGDLEGKPGNTVECTTLTAGQTQTYILTVTAVTGENITYKYAPKP
jgi:Domain of unknown function (DUF4333)